MKDSTLLKLSLSFSIVGLLILLVLTEFVEPHPMSIEDLGDKIDEYVYVEGTVGTATYKQSYAFFDIQDATGRILVAVFDKINNSISVGDRIGVAGEVSLYKGNYEIIADEVICLECGG